MSELHYDRWAFESRGNRPVSARYTPQGWDTTGISWQDYSTMHTQRYVQVQERRLPVPPWALNDKMLAALVVQFTENRVQIHNPEYSLIERCDAAEKIIRTKIPNWNDRIDRIQLEYVAAQKDGTPKERRDELEQEIENLDTLVRMTKKGTTAVVAGVAVLYYRMGKNSVEVADELQIKPPHVRQILYRLHQVWKDYLEEDFMVETETTVVPPCRSLSREEINEKLASGEITIPKGPAPVERVVSQRPAWGVGSLPGEHRKERRARLIASGMCGDCGIRERGKFASCELCRKYFAALGLAAKRRANGIEPESKIESPLPHGRMGRPYIKLDVSRAAELRKTGMGWKQIANELGAKSENTVRERVNRAGLAERRVTMDLKRVVELRKTGMSYKQIANELGVSGPSVICLALQRAGLWERTNKKGQNLSAPAPATPAVNESLPQREPKERRKRSKSEHHEPTARPIPARTFRQKYFGWMKWPR